MAIEKVLLVKASGNINLLDRFIDTCRTSGEFHPENTSEYLPLSMGFTSLTEENPYLTSLQKIEEIAEVSGHKLIASPAQDSINQDEVSEYIQITEENLNTMYAERKILQEQLRRINEGLERISKFSILDVPVEDTTGCEFLSVRYGYLPKEQMVKLKEHDRNPYVFFIPCSEDKDNFWGVYFAPKDKVSEIDRIFAFLYFERIRIPGAVGTPSEIIEMLNRNINLVNKQLSKLESDIALYWKDNGEKCNTIYSRLKWLTKGFDLRRYSAIKKNEFSFIFWVFEKDLEVFKTNFDKIQGLSYEVSEKDESDRITPPVKLKNNKVVAMFESFVSMFGLPSYGSIDITAFVALTYSLIFGIMFGDVGQGAVLLILGLIAAKIPKLQFAKLLIPLGISSALFGFVFGSFFGYEDALDPFYNMIGLNGKPINVMASINDVLTFAIAIGILMVVWAMVLNIIISLKRKAYGEAFFSYNGLTGIVVYLTGVSLVYEFLSGVSLLPGYVIIAIFAIGIPVLLLNPLLVGLFNGDDDWKPKSIGDYIMQSIFETLEIILSYFSNTMSFLRIGAFVLVHAGMMMVVFTLAGESQNILIIALGNLIVIGLEGLIAGIQALRLEFYEMFSRFFEGSGRPFVPAEQIILD